MENDKHTDVDIEEPGDDPSEYHFIPDETFFTHEESHDCACAPIRTPTVFNDIMWIHREISEIKC